MRNSATLRSPRQKKAVIRESWFSELAPLQSSLKHGGGASQEQLDRLAREWMVRIPTASQEEETLVLVDETGCPYESSLRAPRWLCHTLALRHACAHVVLIWDSPKLGPVFVCQVRSWTKKDFPGRVDISVGGHVVGNTSTRQTAIVEMQEELGLQETDLDSQGLQFVGGYECFVTVEDNHFYDVEWRDVYVGHIHSLDPVQFTDGEVSGIYLCPIHDGVNLLTQQGLAVANGLSMSLPLCLDYLEGKSEAGGGL